ncbi:MAG: hypothetical protein GF350_13615 [Chitinivibrionales bacterium]|nr:hypothetical protein [Chitinivibrionales bacterium]
MKSILCIIIGSFCVFSQYSYTTDSIAVREILDANNLETIKVENVTKNKNNRVTTLYLTTDNHQIPDIDSLPSKMYILPNSIGTLTELDTLVISNHDLSVLSDSIAKLNKLKLLHISDNKLNTLPDSFSNFNNLKILYLTGNEFDSLPQSICQLESLEILGLNFNNLTSLPECLVDLPNIKEVATNDNKICSSVSEELDEWLCTYDIHSHTPGIDSCFWQAWQDCSGPVRRPVVKPSPGATGISPDDRVQFYTLRGQLIAADTYAIFLKSLMRLPHGGYILTIQHKGHETAMRQVNCK